MATTRSAAKSAPAASVASIAARRWSTPRTLRILLGAIFGLSGLLFLLGEGTTSRARQSLNVLAHEAAPSIVAAQEIGALLADLDANAANYLLGTRAHAEAASRLYDERRIHVTERIIDAAANISAGDAEKAPVLALLENLGRYEELVAQSRMEKDRDDAAGALDTYRVATALMHDQILASADALDHVKRAYMDDNYADVEHTNRISVGGARLVGFALIAVFLFAQVFLMRRTRRVMSPPLLAATVVTVALMSLLVAKLEDAAEDLRVAKEDAFDSIHLLWRERALVFDANGDESRYLLDPTKKDAHQSAFESRIARLTSRPDDAKASMRTLDTSTLFAQMLHNVTFAGEQDAAALMIRTFAAYYKIDGKMRRLELAGKHDDAIALCIGDADDGSNAALAKFDAALERMLAINVKAFGRTIDSADAGLRTAEVWDPILAIAIAVLAYLGMRPRLKEYAS